MEFLNSEMLKRFMYSAPVNIFFKDTECRYCFASEICNLVSVGENGSIVGKTDLEVQKFPEMGKMNYQQKARNGFPFLAFRIYFRRNAASISMNFRWKMENHCILR